MVDLETHWIIDIIFSRETGQIEDWLKPHPNLQVIFDPLIHSYHFTKPEDSEHI